MTRVDVETYLRRLERELGRRFVVDARLLEEVRGHLDDAIDRAMKEGADDATACRDAIERLGSPAVVAEAVAADRTVVLHRWLLLAAVVVGIAIARVDSRPTWDDTGVTAGAMTLAAGVLGLLGPRRPWAWALAVGIWIPVYAMSRAPSLATLPMLAVLALPFAGAYLGLLLRRVITPVR